MDLSKMTYEQINEQIVALSRTGKTVRMRKLLKSGLRKARNTRDETYLLFIEAQIAHRMEHDYRSALRFYGQALRRAPRNLLFLKSVENITWLVRQVEMDGGEFEKGPQAGPGNYVGSRKRTPKRLYCDTYDAVVHVNGMLALKHA